MPDVSLGRAVLALVSDPTALRSGMAMAKSEAVSWTRSAQQALASAGAAIDQTGQKMTLGVTLPVLAAGKAVLSIGTNFDTTMRQVVGLAGVSEDAIGGVREEILKLGGEVGKTPQELGEAFYFVASAGFKADEAMVVLKTSAQASAAGLGRVQDVAKVLGLTINAYGHANITAARAADVLVAAVRDGTAEADAFAGVLGRVVPTAATLGVSFDQVTAALASMTLTGLSADEAATSLNQVLVSLLKPTSEAAGAMADMGLSAEGLREELREKGLLATLRTLEAAFQGNDDAAAKVFGNVRALRGVLSLLTLDSAQLNEVFADTKGALGDLAEGYKATDGPARNLARAQAELDAALIDLSTDVMPVAVDLIRDLVGFIKGAVAVFKELPPGVRETVIRVLALTAAIGPLLLVGGKMLSAFGALWGLLDKLVVLIVTRFIPSIGALDLSFKGLTLSLGPLLPLLGAVAYHVDTINRLQGEQHEVAQKVIEDQQWVLDHPFIPLWFRGIAEALGLVATEAPAAADGLEAVVGQLAHVDDDAQDARESARILALSLPPVGDAYEELGADIHAWRAKMIADHDAAIEKQRAYTSEALKLLQQFRRDVEDAYKAASDAALDAERTAVAIAEKQIELSKLDEDYTKNHRKWTKIQTAQWRLRKDEALAELNALKLHAALIGDETQQVVGLKALLASRDMKKGLTSEFPEVKAAYQALRDEAIAKLNSLAKGSGPAAEAAANAVSKWLDPANPSSPFNDAGKWGSSTGQAFIGALTHALRVTPEMRAAMGKIGGFLVADSPPRDPTNPLHHIDLWGERTGEAYVAPIVGAIASAALRIRAPLQAVRDVMARPYQPPGLTLAAASVGAWNADAASRAPLLAAGTRASGSRAASYQTTLIMQGRPTRDPFEALYRASRYQRFGLLNPPVALDETEEETVHA